LLSNGGAIKVLQNNLTQKERAYLQDAFEMENLCITKYSVYADQCADQDLKNMMFSITKNKRHHADMIKQELGNCELPCQ
jgi:spore coat protein CotF